MKIERVWSQIVRLPADEPLADGRSVPGATRDIVVVKVATKDGIEGLGVTFFGAGLTGALKVAVDELGALIVGEDPHRVERIADKLRTAAGTSGPAGIFTLALSALDTALWDIRGKALGVSLASLLGGHRDRVPAYARAR
jgi:L-alanine-DL-glutamate epimerase-like enolase superfamily enzyme